jgi:uracil-DNA glycosylase
MKMQELKNKKLILIGQAPPEKAQEYPFKSTRLYKWFENYGVSKDKLINFSIFTALIDYFPGKDKKGHLIPTKEQIEESKPRLLSLINDQLTIVPIGKLAIMEVLNRKCELIDVIGRELEVFPFNVTKYKVKVVPLPHPSGLSTWSYKEPNRQLLNQALEVLSNKINEK